MMKVLIFITQFYELNGAERLGIELAEGLNQRGICADIMSVYGENIPGVQAAQEDIIRRGIHSVFYLGLNIHPSYQSIIPAIVKFRNIIRHNKYDFVETSALSATIIAALGTIGTRTRLVAGLHDTITKERYNNISHKIWRYSIKMNSRSRFYAISEYVKKLWIKYSKTPINHTRVILNGIPDDCFNAVQQRNSICKELGIPANGVLCLFVGRMLKRKGIDTIVDSLGPILKSQNIYLLYVGGLEQPSEGFYQDEDGLIGRMQSKIVQNGWSNNVRFLGRRNDIPLLMASSDLLVHPARVEGFGLVLAEAMAAGLQVVASNVEGIPEVLEMSDSMMVPPDDPESLQAAVLKTLNRKSDEKIKAIEKGRKRADCFRMKTRISKMIDLYEDLLQNKI